MGTVAAMKREVPTQRIIELYMMHLSMTEPSKFSERMTFSLWMYEHHAQWIKHIEKIWQELQAGRG